MFEQPAIGAQAHDAFKLPNDTVKGFIDKLAATGPNTGLMSADGTERSALTWLKGFLGR